MNEIINSSNTNILVHALKYDGQIHRRWEACLAKFEDPLVVLEAKFEAEIRHQFLGTIAPGTLSREYYWLDRWYNIFHFTGTLTSLCKFYCNINIPAKFDGRIVSYIDLDIDILVGDDFSYRVVDDDEFEINANRFNYPASVRKNTFQAVDEIIKRIENRHFPFNEQM